MSIGRDGDYPTPAFAAYIWLAGDKLMLGLPPRESHERGSTVAIPLAKMETTRALGEWELEHQTVDLTRYAATLGFHVLLDVLRAREREGRIPLLAKPGEPLQYNIDEMLRRDTKYDQRGKEAATSLSDLGLDD